MFVLTDITIGYDVSWRQVQAPLLLAAARAQRPPRLSCEGAGSVSRRVRGLGATPAGVSVRVGYVADAARSDAAT